MKQLPERKTIGIQGGYGSFHQQAANKFFGTQHITLAPHGTFLELFLALKYDKVDYAVVAIENSVAGSISTNYPLLLDAKAKIMGEVWLSVKQHLITLPNTTLSMIKEIHSHPMAILQCHTFLEPLIQQGIKIVETSNTALSVKHIHDTQAEHIAAIGSMHAASLYRLDIIAENIQTNIQNYTRFLIVKKIQQKGDSAMLIDKQADKITVYFSTTSSQKSIPHLLKLFSYGNCKITHLHSLPIIDNSKSQQFIIDVVYDDNDVLDNILHLAAIHGYEANILGRYIHAQQQINNFQNIQYQEELTNIESLETKILSHQIN